MRYDLFPDHKTRTILWPTFLDISESETATFSHPHRMHSMLLTEKRFAGF